MNFDFSDDQKLLRDQVRRMLDERCPTSEVRRILEGPEPYSKAVWQQLAELGAIGVAIPEEYGGTGLGYLELCLIAEELGRALAPVPMASSIYQAAEALLQAGTAEQKSAWLPKLADGSVIGTYAATEPKTALRPERLGTTFNGTTISGTKSPVADGSTAGIALVLAKDSGAGAVGDGVTLVLVDLSAKGVARKTIATLDPTRDHATLTFDGAPAQVVGTRGDGWALHKRLTDRAAILLAFEQVGGADRALEIGRDYAMTRYAFGRLIGSYQAIKHKLVEIYAKNVLARSHCFYGAWALSTDAVDLPLAAAAARSAATDAFSHAAQEMTQTHGGIGFTWEHDAHLFYRRARLTALSLGTVHEWKDRLVTQLEQRNVA
ncbi:acyl-CoA dehydrogenase family protein [Zavarzinia sp. CC-PAN008]|uniref:acyl-CoA dehydrogenase family protein n=1 Tax=Zavarzinia sp. CC-PAN008 TaxID=3243332 RepID=UPI003F743370